MVLKQICQWKAPVCVYKSNGMYRVVAQRQASVKVAE